MPSLYCAPNPWMNTAFTVVAREFALECPLRLVFYSPYINAYLVSKNGYQYKKTTTKTDAALRRDR